MYELNSFTFMIDLLLELYEVTLMISSFFKKFQNFQNKKKLTLSFDCIRNLLLLSLYFEHQSIERCHPQISIVFKSYGMDPGMMNIQSYGDEI